jgi:hypothetical protein
MADTQVCPYIFSPLLSKERVRVRFQKIKMVREKTGGDKLLPYKDIFRLSFTIC